MELIKTGVAKDFKKALKLSKKRLGTHRRAMNKRAELEEVIRQQRKKWAKIKIIFMDNYNKILVFPIFNIDWV